MESLSKEYILTTLSEEKLWKTGESNTFKFEDWNIILRKEEDIYKPFTFSITGKRDNSNETWGRRYTSMKQAFLHMFNRFNENVNIRNRYNTLFDALKTI